MLARGRGSVGEEVLAVGAVAAEAERLCRRRGGSLVLGGEGSGSRGDWEGAEVSLGGMPRVVGSRSRAVWDCERGVGAICGVELMEVLRREW